MVRLLSALPAIRQNLAIPGLSPLYLLLLYLSRLSFSRLYLSLLFLPLLCLISVAHAAEENGRDYAINAAVYQWYGKLDQGQIPATLTNTNAEISLPEYAQSPAGGAHHLLSVTLEDSDENPYDSRQQRVAVTLEFLPRSNSGETRGHYLEAELVFDSQTLKLSSLTPQVHEIDDFDSRYRSASETNLIKALVFRWTEQLDNPATITPVAKQIGTQNFVAAEKGQADAAGYLGFLQSLHYVRSRREIKNLNLQPSEQPGMYRVGFEYQWRAWNAEGEEELAQIEVQMTVVIEHSEAQVLEYRETYLPPVTDLGAEIRC
ncbi:hypothetical protein VXM60_16085 [Shewanella khirikhana]|uniref:hypothetical protein n=1 Tax=Shewanella khirikhana TaxID=1965282 RepID=UPI0030CEC2CA